MFVKMYVLFRAMWNFKCLISIPYLKIIENTTFKCKSVNIFSRLNLVCHPIFQLVVNKNYYIDCHTLFYLWALNLNFGRRSSLWLVRLYNHFLSVLTVYF